MSRRTTDSSESGADQAAGTEGASRSWGRWVAALAAVATLAAAGAVTVVTRPWERGGEAPVAQDPPLPPAPPPVLPAGSTAALAAQGADAPDEAVHDLVDELVDDAAGGGTIAVSVVDVATGEALYTRKPDEPIIPASTVKLVTGTTVLASRDPAARLPTTVVAGEDDGEVVLVGGGDPTLAVDDDAFFPGAARLADLADQVTAAAGEDEITRVTVDADLFDGPVHGAWGDDIPHTGYVGPITALMLDGARADPDPSQGQLSSRRYSDPDLAAGEAFADLLGLDDDAVSRGSAPAPPPGAPDPAAPVGPDDAPQRPGSSVSPGASASPATSASPGASASPGEPVGASTAPGTAEASAAAAEPGTVLGRVLSPTIQNLVEIMLTTSDNAVAESLARQVALARGEPATFAGATDAMAEVLDEVVGVPLGAGTLADGSGLSRDNALRPGFLTALLRQLATDPARPALGGVFAGLPVAAWSGTLDGRYVAEDGDSEPGPAAGVVRAKTGSLTGVNALAGTVTTDGGRPLVFALLTEEQTIVPWEAREALDEVATALATCEC